MSSLAALTSAGVFYLVWRFLNPFFLFWVFGSLVLAGLAVVLPFSRTTALKIKTGPGLHDERDIMFARARYAAGSAAYKDYYSRFPHRKKIDDFIRSLPALLAPGGRFFEPVRAKIAAEYFEQVEGLYPFVCRPPFSVRTAQGAEEITQSIKQQILALGAVDVGVAKMAGHFLYSHVGRGPGGYGTKINLPHPYVVVFAVSMAWEAVRSAPDIPVIVESARRYWTSGVIAVTIAARLRSLGYQARAHIDGNYRMILPAAGVQAGLGEIGRIGLLVHPVYGPRMRLGAVSTDLVMVPDKPVTFGVQEFCAICKKCAVNCPVGAISHGGKKTVLGVEKWSTNQSACYRYWRTAGTDCGVCMRVCPYSKPNSPPHPIIRSVIQRSYAARRLAVWGDDLFYGKHIHKGGGI